MKKHMNMLNSSLKIISREELVYLIYISNREVSLKIISDSIKITNIIINSKSIFVGRLAIILCKYMLNYVSYIEYIHHKVI